MDRPELWHAISAVLEEQRGRSSGGDAEIALHYAANAARWACMADDRTAERPLRELVVELVRDAANLYRADSDDEDGVGFATLREVVSALGARLGVELRSEPESPSGPTILSVYGTHRWFPGSFREQFTPLPPDAQRAFIERASRHAAYVRGLMPTEMEHAWFLAWCWALHGDWKQAVALARRAMDRGAVILEAAAASPQTFEFMLRDAHRLSEALARHALEVGVSAELSGELRDAYVLVTQRRYGVGSDAHRAALRLG